MSRPEVTAVGNVPSTDKLIRKIVTPGRHSRLLEKTPRAANSQPIRSQARENRPEQHTRSSHNTAKHNTRQQTPRHNANRPLIGTSEGFGGLTGASLGLLPPDGGIMDTGPSNVPGRCTVSHHHRQSAHPSGARETKTNRQNVHRHSLSFFAVLTNTARVLAGRFTRGVCMVFCDASTAGSRSYTHHTHTHRHQPLSPHHPTRGNSAGKSATAAYARKNTYHGQLERLVGTGRMNTDALGGFGDGDRQPVQLVVDGDGDEVTACQREERSQRL